MRVLLDTNVLLDAIEVRKEFFDDSCMVVLLAAEYDGFIVASSATDIYYIEHKRNHSKEKTKAIMDKIFSLFDILDTTSEDCRNALRSDIPDFEDAIIVESAKRNDMDCIVTRNTKDFKNSNIPVHTPVEFLELLSTKQGISTKCSK